MKISERVKILIVDDDPIFAKVLKTIISNALDDNTSILLRVHHYLTLAEAIEESKRSSSIAVVFMDKNLVRPDGKEDDGFDGIKIIKEYHPETQIIGITGNNIGADEARAMRNGASF